MAKEVERKFKVTDDSWRAEITKSYLIDQGYLLTERDKSIRVRIRSLLTEEKPGEPECCITVKYGTSAISCDEFEYPIPHEDALSMMEHAKDMTLVKIRHHVEFGGRLWEIDEFQGRHKGLIIAEIESADAASINNFPAWVGLEVTYDSYFKNANLVSVK